MTAGMDSGGDQSSGMTTSIQSDDAGDKNGYYNPLYGFFCRLLLQNFSCFGCFSCIAIQQLQRRL
jgi:hypothetical protein